MTPNRAEAAEPGHVGLPPEVSEALALAASEGRELWLSMRLQVPGHQDESWAREDGREDGTVFVRASDPGDPDDAEPPRIHVRPGEHIVTTTPIAAAGFNTTDQVGRVDDLVTSVRVVLDRRENGIVYGRSLRPGEPDDGRRIHVRPGEVLTFEPGALTVSLDVIDAKEEAGEDGYVNLAPVVWTWLSFASPEPAAARYWLAAARRLDAAAALRAAVQEARSQFAQDAESHTVAGPVLRRELAALIGSVELFVVALGRVVDMVVEAEANLACPVSVPARVREAAPAIRALRNAYEHIEDRALGQVNGRPHPEALTVFEYGPLLGEDALVYGAHRLELGELPELIADLREFVKAAVAGRPGSSV